MTTKTSLDEEAFVVRVARLARLPTRTAARRAIQATVVELGERLSDGERAHFADVLPDRWAEVVRATAYRGAFDVAELFERVSRHEGIDLASSREHALVVCRVIAERAPVESLARIGRVFPEGIATLFRRSLPVAPAACYRLVRRKSSRPRVGVVSVSVSGAVRP
jgi:uncharacterized protein (DUF2267 family)